MNTFRALGLPEPLLAALADVGYESPSPIQAATIPVLLAGSDLVGQAQTGTGKTAAFALPLLARLDLAQRAPQVLVLTPTRELAIQVAEAFQRYAAHLPGFHVLPVYGGQGYGPQLHALKRGTQVIVGTPGRVMDHMKRGTLVLGELRALVLDEADEMLRMGFIEDVEWILGETPEARQVALFSATMPAPIRRIAQKYLRSPAEVTIGAKTTTAANIRQRYWMVSGLHKLDALTRILEVEPFEGMLVFARTKQATVELAERLEARGFAAAALNGDVPQMQRERIVAQLKSGEIDIVVATDVAARGLDVERIGHVVNFDVPTDPESYVHRIGRTGRAGRSGEAILFIAPRERNLLRAIERATRQTIEPMSLPTVEDVNVKRVARFRERIGAALEAGAGAPYRALIEMFARELEVPEVEIAAALAAMMQGKTPLLLQPEARERREQQAPREHDPRPAREHPARERPAREGTARRSARLADVEMETFRVEVGRAHGVRPANIVGAIASEAGLAGKHIGRVDIRGEHSFVDLPGGMPKEILRALQKVIVMGQPLRISRMKRKPRA
ncbi:MAG TPA: DEAD/DEAH box helicase [Pseudomonadales bacterium]|nr:DEAD/DEAH box helicase [Pseudomonadales bacterium]